MATSVHRRRRAVAGAVVAAAAAGTAGATTLLRDDPPADEPPAVARERPAPLPQLPGGGRRILPDRRVVGFYGNPADRQLGILGIGKPRTAGRRLLRQARPYERRTRPVLPAFELIAVVANAHPGDDGLYRRRESAAVIRRYLRAARQIDALLILDIQPGRADFFTETRRLERWLREPDVGLALDPEWRVAPGAVPGKVIGSVDAREVNAVSAWLDQLTARHRLPQKLLIVHQFTFDMIVGRERLKERPNVAIVLNADGFGGPEIKRAKYRGFAPEKDAFHEGFKLFYEEDVDLMSPRQVLRLRPPPDVVVYE